MSLVTPNTLWGCSEPLSLYLHVPFCRKKCSYCGFFSCDSGASEDLRPWLKNIIKEFLSWKELVNLSGVHTVYFGGGTPSVLSLTQWRELFDVLSLTTLRPSHIPKERFATIEVNPGSLNEDKLKLWWDRGVGRLSLGVQSFNKDVLIKSGRDVVPKEIFQALELIKHSWPGQWSLDLICGLPGQTGYILREDLESALSWSPDHLALYEYIQEPETRLDQEIKAGLTVPLAEDRQSSWIKARDFLESQGYQNYEISNFSLPGRESLHNLAYWESRPYLGLGPGATSFLRSESGWARFSNPESWNWSGANLAPWGDRIRENLGPEELLLELLLSGLRLRSGVNRLRFEYLMGKTSSDLWKGVKDADRGFYREDANTWGLTSQGRDIQDWLLTRYDTSWICT